MKTHLSFVAFLVSTTMLFAQTVVENPAYEAKNSGFPEIIRIEQHPEKSILYFRITSMPGNWVQINQDMFIQDSEKRGEEMMTTRLIGAEFGQQIHFPAAGTGDTILGFEYPPIPGDWEKMDWKSHSDGSWAIYGIAVDGSVRTRRAIPPAILTWLNEPVRDKRDITEATSELFFHTDSTYLKGYIQGYDRRLGFTSGILYYSSTLYDQDQPLTVQIEPDGRFTGHLLTDHPTNAVLSVGNLIMKNLYFRPGETTSFSIRWDDAINSREHPFKHPVEYYGVNKQVNKGFDAIEQIYDFDWNRLNNDIKTHTPDTFKEQYLKRLPGLISDVERYCTKNSLTGNDSLLMQYYVKMYLYQNLLDYEMDRNMPQQEKSDLPGQITPDFYDFIRDIPVNDPLLLAVRNFDTFLNRMEFMHPLRERMEWVMPLPEINQYAYLHSKNIPLTETQEEAMAFFLKDNGKSHLYQASEIEHYSNAREILQPLVEQYPEYISEYLNKYVVNLQQKDAYTLRREVAEKKMEIARTLGLAPSLMYDIILMHKLYFALDQQFSENREDALKYSSFISGAMSDPYMQERALQLFLEKFTAEGKKTFELPEGKGTDLFRELIAPYKGKMVLVDFWATTCGPCIAGIRNMAPMRESMKEKTDVAFLFITSDGDSPKSAYDRFVNENSLNDYGNHYLTNDDYLLLRELFRFNGIPRYLLVDRYGDVLDINYQPHNFKSDSEKER